MQETSLYDPKKWDNLLVILSWANIKHHDGSELIQGRNPWCQHQESGSIIVQLVQTQEIIHRMSLAFTAHL